MKKLIVMFVVTFSFSYVATQNAMDQTSVLAEKQKWPKNIVSYVESFSTSDADCASAVNNLPLITSDHDMVKIFLIAIENKIYNIIEFLCKDHNEQSKIISYGKPKDFPVIRHDQKFEKEKLHRDILFWLVDITPLITLCAVCDHGLSKCLKIILEKDLLFKRLSIDFSFLIQKMAENKHYDAIFVLLHCEWIKQSLSLEILEQVEKICCCDAENMSSDMVQLLNSCINDKKNTCSIQ